MTIELILCLLLIFNLKPINCWNYCEEISCDFFDNVEYKLNNSRSDLDVIRNLSASVNNSLQLVTDEFTPSTDQALSELDKLSVMMRDVNNNGGVISKEVPETLLFQLKMEEETQANLEEIYGKLLIEMEGNVEKLLQISKKKNEIENLLEIIRKRLNNLEQDFVTFERNFEQLKNNKTTISEFDLLKKSIILECDRIRSNSLLMLNASDFNLTNELNEIYNINVQLFQYFREVEELQKSVETMRETNNKLDEIEEDAKKYLELLVNTNVQTTQTSNNNQFIKSKTNDKKEGLSIAEIIKSQKENKDKKSVKN